MCDLAPLTVIAFHLGVIASFDEADVSQVEDACNDVEHLNLDVAWDPNHLHGFLEKGVHRQRGRAGACCCYLLR